MTDGGLIYDWRRTAANAGNTPVFQRIIGTARWQSFTMFAARQGRKLVGGGHFDPVVATPGRGSFSEYSTIKDPRRRRRHYKRAFSRAARRRRRTASPP